MFMPVFFDSRKLPKPKKEYVAFVDIMGTKSHMKNGIDKAADYMFKLHAAILWAWRSEKNRGVFVYPVMDGAYITATSKENMEKIMVRIYKEIAERVVKANGPEYQFIVRAAIAYGETIHGHHVPYGASKAFEMDLSYKNSILLGSAMIDAYEGEGKAAPFGIYVHNSAIKTSGDKSRTTGAFPDGWKWFESSALKIDDDIISGIPGVLTRYFDDAEVESSPLHYDLNKIKKHREAAKEYYGTDI